MQEFIVVGVNYKKTDISMRNKFAFTIETLNATYRSARNQGKQGFFILSTCNRTEIYSASLDVEDIIQLFKAHTDLSYEEIKQHIFVKRDSQAFNHVFRVASGIDSQILGDYEIIGQMRGAFNRAKDMDCTSGFLEKIVNSALHCSRMVRQKTSISDGTTSVSYAVIQKIKTLYDTAQQTDICILGLGKIGTNTVENVRSYLPNFGLTAVNRNITKAEALAEKHDINFDAIENLNQTLKSKQILVVATGADQAIVQKEHITDSSVEVIFDLSMPSNVSKDVQEMEHITYFDIDTLSQRVQQVLKKRKQDIPLAEAIIQEHIDEINDWQVRKIRYTMCPVCTSMPSCNLLKDAKNWDTEKSACVMAS